jgi:hypothetical protein
MEHLSETPAATTATVENPESTDDLHEADLAKANGGELIDVGDWIQRTVGDLILGEPKRPRKKW